MDSLMALELRLALEARLRIDIPLMSLAEGASVAALAARLSDTISQPGQRAAVIDLAARHETVLDRFDLADLGADE
jgi:phthiocerol/phenolphthiocerol synthesis type-I polyketide synthase C